MTLADTMNGSEWIMWVVFGIFLIMTVVLLSGHGAGLIAGYNTASKEEQEKYDTKKLCRVMGSGMAVITILILTMAVGTNILPASFAYVSLAVIIVDCIVLIVLCNTICKK